MADERSGALWVSVVRRGVFRLANGQWAPYGGIPSLPKQTAITLATDVRGRIWFGYAEGQVAVLDGDNMRLFAGADGPTVGNVTAMHGRRKGLWVGGELGLAGFDGERFRTLSAEAGTSLNGITGIVETADGDLWLNGAAGILHITAAQVRSGMADPTFRVHAVVFNMLDGLEGTSARLRPLPTAVEGADGRLWFTTSAGIYTINPARIFRNTLPPPVQISAIG